MFRGGPSPQSF